MAESEDPAVRGLIDLAAATYGRARESELSSHPSPDELVQYQEGRLASPQADVIRSHLVVCEQCAGDLHRLDDFDRQPDAAAGDTAAAARSWARFRDRAELEGPLAGAAAAVAAPPGASPIRWLAWALAASVMLAATGVGFFVLAIQRASPARDRGAVGIQPFVLDLLPDGAHPRRDTSGIETVEVPRGMDPIIVRLLLGNQTPYASYSAVVSRPSGGAAWQQRKLRRQPSGELVLLVPRASLPEGDWVIRLDGEGEGRVQRIASYTLRIRYGE